VAVSPIRDAAGEIVGAANIARDVTERKRQQAVLVQLERSNKELDQFASVASHDLQEPLRKIAAYIQLFREECGEQINDAGRNYLDVVANAALRLRTLISDLLAFSRVAARGKPLVPTNATSCVQSAIERLEVAIAESGAQVTFDPLPVMLADESQLTQIFQNLIENAVKYRNEAVACRVQIGGRDLGSRYEFFVRDNGIGIDPQFFERIFEIFQRLHNQREYGGTGIGLAICRRIVERFGGKIRVESAPGEGSTFYFTAKRDHNEGADDDLAH